MTNETRRRFLQFSAAFVGGGPLAACNGEAPPEDGVVAGEGGTDKPASPAPSPSPIPSPTPSPEPAPSPAAPPPSPGTTGFVLSSGAMQFTLSSASTQQAAPFCLGFAFRRGEIPAGQTVVSSAGTLQVTQKNSWPDGSLKFAILAGRVDLTANTPAVLRLRKTTSAGGGGAALALADMKRTGIEITVSASGIGNAVFSGASWDSSMVQSWVAGPEMSSWVFRQGIPGDRHLVAWLEVRYFAGGAVEVLPWIENGYLNVSEPTLKRALFGVQIGTSSRFSANITMPHHTRTPLVNGAALSYWLGNDPGVVPQQDKLYLQSTELVPRYMSTASDASVTGQAAAAGFNPLQQGDYKFGPDQLDLMPNSGYGEPLGLLPGWDVKLLTCSPGVHATAFAVAIRNAYSAGRYPIHYRDESTNRPPAFSSHPTRCLFDYRNDGSGFKSAGGSPTGTYTPAITDTSGTLVWDTAHSPAVGYLPYLLTGRFYFMEETQFAVTTNFLGCDAGLNLRAGAKGLHQPAYQAWQVRACAWGLRSLAQALCITPDTDLLRGDFQQSMHANIDFYYGRYVAQPNNPLGFIFDWDQGPRGEAQAAPWQADFLTGVVGYALAMGLPMGNGYEDKLLGFFKYTAKSIVGRLGASNSSDWWYINAFTYQAMVAPRFIPDWVGGTGPWFTSWRAAYDATYATRPPWLGTTEGALAYEYSRPIDAVRGYFGNAMPAIAYAVRHGVPGALAAYARVTSASNFPSWAQAFNDFPVWGVVPSRFSPAWLQGKPQNEWFATSGTAGAGSAPLNDFSGFALTADGKIAAGAAGGHGGSRDNRVVVLDLLSDAPAWRVLNQPSASAPDDVAYNPDGKPASRHTYASTLYVPYFDRVVLFGVRYTAPGAITFNKVDGFDVRTGAWDGGTPGSPGTRGSGYADVTPGYYGAVVDGSGDVWSVFGLQRYRPSTNSWSSPISNPAAQSVRYPWAWDSQRGMLFGLCWGDGEGSGTGVRAIKQDGTTQTQVTFNSTAALNQFIADAPTYAGMDYDPENDRFLFYSTDAPARIYVVTPNNTNVWDMGTLQMGPGTAAMPSTRRPLVGKFRYVPQLKGFVCLPEATAELYFLRTA